MRAGGGSTVHQALTNDAANVVKQAVTLARRRGHAQVTPLHVANTMLSASTGLFRTACVQSHSHPLQCRALELCFNVALNRLPASSSSPMLGGHHHSQYPSISNALVAAFKRAQAHQRRGCIENQQQQSLLAVKIELEQLIISILDDPSVSRVMREAGFSSTQVKSNVEQAVSLEICSKHTSVKRNQDVNVKGSDPLSLSLITSSDVQSQSTSLILLDGEDDDEEDGGEEKELSCCADCSAKFQNEVQIQSLQNSNSESTSLSHHPPWFQSYKDDNKGLNDKDSASIRKLCKKWNSFCNSVHKQPYNSSERTHTLVSSISPPKQPSSSNPNSTPNSGSSSDVVEMEYVHKFKEMNAENLTTLCNALEKKVPWQKDIIPVIVSTILKCRSGMLRRRGTDTESSKEETWLFFQGVDVEAKEKIAKELARLVFGSQTKFTTIALSSFSSTRADSMEDSRNHKRLRDEQSCSYIERFAEAVSSDPHRVFFVEDVEQADYCSQMGFKRAMESGRVRIANGEEDIVSDAIVIFSSESYSSRSRACSPLRTQKFDGFDQEDKVDALDLNVCIEDDGVEEQSIENIGIYESVDGRIAFKIQEL